MAASFTGRAAETVSNKLDPWRKLSGRLNRFIYPKYLNRLPGSEVIKFVSCSTQLSMKF